MKVKIETKSVSRFIIKSTNKQEILLFQNVISIFNYYYYLYIDQYLCFKYTCGTLPLSVTSRFEVKNFYRNESVPFSFLNFTSISDTENLKSDGKK
jgi:hypothetical protein